MDKSGDEDQEARTKLDRLNVCDKVVYDGRQYAIRMINRNSGDLLCRPVLGGVQRWFHVDQVSLPVEEE